VFKLKISSNDCLILMIGFVLVLNIFVISFYVRMKKMIATLTSSQSLFNEINDLSKKCSRLNDEFEKVAMIRIAELQDRITKLKDLVAIADEKIVQIIELQKNVENAVNSIPSGFKSGGSLLANMALDSDLITKFRLNMRPDLSNLEGKMLGRLKDESARIYEELSRKIEDLKIKSEPLPKPLKDIVAHNAALMVPPSQPAVPVNNQAAKLNKSDYIIPKENLEPSPITGKHAEVYRLAEEGYDAAAISEITKIEKRTINTILNLRRIM